MIKRLVKMQFKSSEVQAFQNLFLERKATIAAFPGCTHLELWRDAHHPEVFFTYSIWRSEADLHHYRCSAFFRETWALTRVLFEQKAEAWSVMQQ